jgi:hypothetical protein
MGTSVNVNTATFSTTHVATNLLRSLKTLIVVCGLDSAKLVGEWSVLERGVETWLRSRHLTRLILEIYMPTTGTLIKRFDFEIDYSYHPEGNGDLWLDAETVRYAANKAGTVLSTCTYDILATTASGRPDVAGWSNGTLRSTSGLTQRSVGAAVGGGALGASLSHWS